MTSLQSTRLGPWRITFDTNPDDCNLHCIMCEQHSHYAIRRRSSTGKRRMDIALVHSVLEESRGTPLREIIPSTMGEPLLYRHMDEFIDLCSSYGVKLNLTTNGTFPGRGARGWAKRIVPVACDVKVSWNGACRETQESIMLGSSWSKMIEDIRTLVQVRDAHPTAGHGRCRITLQMTFLETNVDEMPDIVELAARLGIDRVKGHHLWVHCSETEHLSMRRSPEAIARWNEAVRQAQAVAERCQLPGGGKVVLDNIISLQPQAGSDIAPDWVCPFLGREAWVSAEGRFSPCCAPDEQRRTLGDFGTLYERSFYGIWESDDYRHLVETYKQQPLCARCHMRRPEGA